MLVLFQWCQCVQDIGAGKGKYYAVNYPLRDGIDDESYEAIFKPVSFQFACFCANKQFPVFTSSILSKVLKEMDAFVMLKPHPSEACYISQN